MKKYSLSATPRNLVGRKVKTLRKQGLVPATIYGKKVKSVSVSVKTDEFTKVFQEAGESGLVELTIEGEKKTAGLPAGRQVLVHSVQTDPVRDTLLHVEFHQVDLKEKVRTHVPVECTGEPAAVANKLGVLLTIADEVEVEALPTDLPEKLVIDISGLAEVDAEVKIKDLNVPTGVVVLTDVEQTLVKIGALVTKAAEAEAAAEEAAKAAAEAAEAPAEGAPAEPAAEEKPEEKKEEVKKE